MRRLHECTPVLFDEVRKAKSHRNPSACEMSAEHERFVTKTNTAATHRGPYQPRVSGEIVLSRYFAFIHARHDAFSSLLLLL